MQLPGREDLIKVGIHRHGHLMRLLILHEGAHHGCVYRERKGGGMEQGVRDGDEIQ